MTPAEIGELQDRLRALGDDVAARHQRNPDPREVAAVLVGFTRDMAEVHTGIGKHVLTVALTRWGHGYCEFHGAEEHPLWLTGPSRTIKVDDTAQRPWIIAPGMQAAPAYEVTHSDQSGRRRRARCKV